MPAIQAPTIPPSSRVMTITGVLDADEQGSLVRGEADAGDFAAYRADHETADLAAVRVGAQHLVVAHAGKVAGVAHIAIGQNPQPPGVIEPKPIRAVEHVCRGDVT